MLSRSRTTIPLNGMPLPPKHKRVAGGLLSGSGFTMAIKESLFSAATTFSRCWLRSKARQQNEVC
jgi:hypothetical protein